MKALRPLFALALGITLSASFCGPTAVVATQENPFKGIIVSSPTKIVALGEEATFGCVPQNQNNTKTSGTMSYGVQGSSLVQSDNPTQDGEYVLLRAVALGTTTLTCTFKAASTGETFTATGVYEVRDLVISIEAASQTLLKGMTKILTATARHPGTGAEIPISEGSFTWKSSAEQFVTLQLSATTKTAEAMALNGPGSSTITVTFDRPAAFGHIKAQTGTGTAIVNVILDPNAAALTVTTPSPTFTTTVGSSVFVPYTVQSSSGAAVTDATITTSTTAQCTVLSTSSTQVLVRGVASGNCQVTITAEKNGATGSKVVPVTVNAAAATSANLVAAGTGTPVGGTRQLTGIMPTGDLFQFSASGMLAAGSSVPWANQVATSFTSSNTAIVTVSSTGVVMGVSAGTANITAQWSSGGVDYTATFAELVGTLDTAIPLSITIGTISGLSSTVRVGKVTAYRCSASNSGTPIVANTVWTTSNASAATVNSAGIVTGVGAGSATITCNINGRTASMSTTVTP